MQVFESSLIPGLLQTDEYAHALIRKSLPGEHEERVNELAAARMRRKRVFDKAEPPFYWANHGRSCAKAPSWGRKVHDWADSPHAHDGSVAAHVDSDSALQ
ncbi:Scr1 family TA system antitoxin-like transcriptional regulator [Streptomyces decoyicus]